MGSTTNFQVWAFALNKSDNAVTRRVTVGGKAKEVAIPAWSIAEVTD